MYNYCTLFDSAYLSRGLAMYESLKSYACAFHLYIFAFDERSFKTLYKLNLEHVTVIKLADFEDESLLAVKGSRSKGEHCWTCTPSVIKYCLDNYQLDHCTYLDADLYFFNDPAVLLEELGGKSVLITEHRYTPKYDQSETSGIYCVQFMTFRNTVEGMAVLSWWRDACIDWCYAKAEDGKFGDQKYLDDWPARFAGVHVLKNPDGGVAPWNVQQYDLSHDYFNIVFYHFHDFKFLSNDRVDLGHYELSDKAKSLIYKPYINKLLKVELNLKQAGFGDFDCHGIRVESRGMGLLWRNIKRRVKGNFNIYSVPEILEM